MSDELERRSTDQDVDRALMDEIDAEGATALPNKEVMSLLDVNANVDLGLDLAAPVDLAVAANLNLAGPIEASWAANLLSSNAEAVSVAQQHGTIDQGISGSAEATAPQHADISQDSNSDDGAAGATTEPAAGGRPAGGSAATGGALEGTTGAVDGATGAVDGATGAVDGAVDGATGA